MWLKVCTVIFLSMFSALSAARILGIFPVRARSHFAYNHAIMRSLHDVGHQITMIGPFPQPDEENFTYVDSLFNTTLYVGRTTIDEVTDLSLDFMFQLLRNSTEKNCNIVVQLPVIQEAVHSSSKLYDVVFTEVWLEHICFAAIAEKLGIPLIGTSTVPIWKWADASIGNRFNPAVVPETIAPKLNMNLVERIQNVWRFFALDYYFDKHIRGTIEQFYRNHFRDRIFDSEVEISLIFYNSIPSLLPRSLVPNAIEIGGIHVENINPLPQDLQKFIDEAPRGVVLVSLGSVVRASSMSSALRNAFLSAFASIPQRVIWKFEDPIENVPSNVIISDWIPQRDILEHEKVVAFISHCGLSGVYEAVFTGTPVIATPIFSDQHMNAEILLNQEVAVGLDLKTATKGKILAALDTIINDTSYRERMDQLSPLVRDRPMTPQQSVVYWTEYVIRHNGTRHLKVLGKDMPLYKYLMLDIIALGLLCTSTTVFLVVAFIRRVCATKTRVNIVKKRE